MSKVRRIERGAAALEFAILVPVILLLVFGIIAYAYMFSFRQALSQAAAEGARAAVGAPTTCAAALSSPYAGTSCPAQSAAAAAVSASLSGYDMSCGVNYLTCVISAPFTGTSATGASCPSTHSCVQVQVSYPYRAHSLLPTVPGLGFTLPTTLAFSSVVQVS
ncbi:pilus assembly protein [Nocardioides sp. BP30]|uniref:TadE/TadG family type IV pilus assembly protein n=1 Tax=Nocardioides sp. BP30 TaxID=3036374 RepID=UPI0024685AC5|nr:pilus assembly protein [Nocardioides sp. BP30]WGL53715.1 pilus assembly protein [Nocardioides sp. BP30]